jgi:AcrR family transcriptional regulator
MMSEVMDSSVPPDLVRAAIRVARQRAEDVADVPLRVLAEAAGISQSTLVRRIGGSRRALDDAVRAAGVDPGGRRPVRQRAVEAAAWLISERGLAAATMEAVAAAAECSVHSLYAVFGSRDELLTASYENYSPILDVERLMSRPSDSITETVTYIYRALAASLTREPRVAPAMLAEAFSRPDGAASRVLQRYFPRVLDSVGAWLVAQAQAGRIRPLPVALLIQQLVGPLVVHLFTRPVMTRLGHDLPDTDETCALFAEAFVRAVAVPQPPQTRRNLESMA